ncbi:MAG: hypothetical protein HRU20_19510 [Pseudomonadales bacterium]|nr:hypothetical protein [Pseudomonadales bacterium]
MYKYKMQGLKQQAKAMSDILFSGINQQHKNFQASGPEKNNPPCWFAY